MDLVFNALPDVFSYQSFRHTTYDAPWLNDVNPNKGAGRRALDRPRQPASSQQPAASSCSGRKDSCPLCQEKQRRPLATYIRSKSRQDRKEESSIQEEEEEEEEEEASASQQQEPEARPPRRPTPTSTPTRT